MAVVTDHSRCNNSVAFAPDQDSCVRALPRQRDLGRGIVPPPCQFAAVPQRNDAGDIGIHDRRYREFRKGF